MLSQSHRHIQKHFIFILILLLYTLSHIAFSIVDTLQRYHTFRLGWAWDLAYYNQWYWSLTQADGILSVRPISAFADEGPSVWKMNYLTPLRFMLVPVYSLFPDPRTLLVAHAVIFWLVIPAAYLLVKQEAGSSLLALTASFLVPFTPLIAPLSVNDFREIQLGIPFILIALAGWRSRSLIYTIIGIAGLLACRQEYGVLAASLIVIPAREPESAVRTDRWRRIVLVIGLVWFLFVYFGYLTWKVGPSTPKLYVNQFGGPKATFLETLKTSSIFLFAGLGSWTVFALLAPRTALLVIPWVWSLSNGRYNLPEMIGTDLWHHVRYTAPMVGMGLGAGLIGYVRVWKFLSSQISSNRTNQRAIALLGLFGLTLSGLLIARHQVERLRSQIPGPVPRDEVSAIWSALALVQPDDEVLAAYEVTVPLSSRRKLFSDVLDSNHPPGYPFKLSPKLRWLFVYPQRISPQIFQEQGFVPIHKGRKFWVYRRDEDKPRVDWIGFRHAPPKGEPP